MINIVVADDWALVPSGFRALVCQWPSCVPRLWPLTVLTSRACSGSSRSSFLPPGYEVGGGGCALVAFLDGLLDALPGLAVLGTGHVIAAGYYTRVARSWGPSPVRAQQIGGTAMIALSELVGLPTLIVLLAAWVRSDARQASDIDAALDTIDAAEQAARDAHDDPAQDDRLQRPWWSSRPVRWRTELGAAGPQSQCSPDNAAGTRQHVDGPDAVRREMHHIVRPQGEPAQGRTSYVSAAPAGVAG